MNSFKAIPDGVIHIMARMTVNDLAVSTRWPRILCNRNEAISHLQTEMGFLRTSVAAYTIDRNTFSAPFGIFYVRTEIQKEIFQKKSYIAPQWGTLYFQTTISKWKLP